MEQYLLYAAQDDITELLRIAMFESNLDNITITDDPKAQEELHTNLFHPSLWALEVTLLCDEVNRAMLRTFNTKSTLLALQYAFSQSSIDSLANIEQFKAHFYTKLGQLQLKD